MALGCYYFEHKWTCSDIIHSLKKQNIKKLQREKEKDGYCSSPCRDGRSALRVHVHVSWVARTRPAPVLPVCGGRSLTPESIFVGTLKLTSAWISVIWILFLDSLLVHITFLHTEGKMGSNFLQGGGGQWHLNVLYVCIQLWLLFSPNYEYMGVVSAAISILWKVCVDSQSSRSEVISVLISLNNWTC